MHFSSDESAVKEESTKPTQDMAFSTGVKADNFLGVDASSSPGSYDSHSHSESSTFRASNAPEDINNISKTVSKDSSPKSAVCSNKSDLTEISSLRNYASIKNEEQVESSLQGAQSTGLVIVQSDDENKGDVAENHLDQKEPSVRSTIVLGEQENLGVSVQAIAVEDKNQSHDAEVEVTICDICGDLGREKLLAVCSKCGEGAEHIYCMPVKLEDVPKNWVCEDCIIAEKDGKQKEDENWKEEPLNATELELQSEKSGAFDPKSSLDSKDEELGSMRNQEHKSGSCFLDERSEKALETPSANQIRNSRKRKPALTQDCSVNKFFKPKSMEPGIVSPGVSVTELQKRPIGHSSTGGCANALLSSTFYKSGIHESLQAPRKRCNIGQNLLGDDDPFDGRQCFRGSPLADPSQFHSSPLPYCIWQGRFKLQKNQTCSSFCNGVQAHLSRSASHNSLTLAPGFTQDILLEEASRSTVWKTEFSGIHASAENIHIYFFAKDSESYENNYKRLLEHMIRNDVYLKGSIGGFELLIFSSNALEEGFQRWNGLYFLWGVFRDPTRVPSTSSISYSRCHEEHLQVAYEYSLVEHLQMRGRTFPEQSKSLGKTETNMGRHSESTPPDLELSLGLGGGSTRTGRTSKQQKVSSSNIHADEPLLSLSLSLPQPFLGEEVWRHDPVTMGQRNTERGEVDMGLSLCSDFCRI